MKKSLLFLLLAELSSHAALVYFDISPLGSDVAVGLSPSNAVPAVTNSTGSGDSISGGVVFDTRASVLQLAVGYGSAAGFTDLSGPVTQLSINGPAAAGQTAAPLFDLAPFIFPAVDPARGGVIYGSVVYPTNAIAGLMAGSNYLNLATAANPTGELRGQLIPIMNRPPVLICPEPITVQCGARTNVSVVVSDPDGDALTVVWTLNGRKVQRNTVPAGQSLNPTNVSLAVGPLSGTNLVAVAVTDTATNTVSCSTTITVVDTTPPVIQSAAAKPNVLWPPNHKMVKVTLNARVTDNCGSTSWQIVAVRSAEPDNGTGDGNTSPDWSIVDNHTVSLRAERSGTDGDRVYSVDIVAVDSSGNTSEIKTVTVTVPKSQGKKK